MRSMLRLVSTVAVLLIPASAGAQYFTDVRLGTSRGYADEWPEASDSGRVVVFQRAFYEPGTVCGQILVSDVYTARLMACGSSILTRITKNGISLDPTISADGARIAWRTYDATATTNRNRIHVACSDGTLATENLALDGEVSGLELSPLGDWIAFRVIGRVTTGVTEIIQTMVDSPSIDIAASSTTNGGITVNRDGWIADDGKIAYTKLNGLTHDAYTDTPTGSPVVIDASTSAEERYASMDRTGDILAFRRTTSSGVSNVRVYSLDPTVLLGTTTNTAVSVTFNAVTALSAHVLYDSNGNFASQNSDASTELFRYDIGTTTHRQLTSFAATMFAPKRAIAGAALSANGWALTYATGPATSGDIACDEDDLNERGLWLGGLPGDVVIDDLASATSPPFFFVISVSGTDCAQVPGTYDIECDVRIENSAEGSRRLLVKGFWDVATSPVQTQRDDPGPFTLQASEYAAMTFRFVNAQSVTPTGTFLVHVLSPDQPMADTISHTFSF